ncbi:hypothetical protein AXG93_2090s1050 [Marchantia polymorpha subsp. ruderalis]|uniref:Uncharacterized protein n=1 Tax=Marchantia polymorpha subsp. ruderalis TaxID=1480154 RepID=A0A176W8Q3_MARPO|nr:hypothetical protein AXG93_2090s1050 [Marchantia polymorpha subsp. ruderalis]
MYIRAQSPESSNCCGSLAPLAPLISSSHSSRADDGGRAAAAADQRALDAGIGIGTSPAKNVDHINGSKRKNSSSISFRIDDGFNYGDDVFENEDRIVNFSCSSSLHQHQHQQQQQQKETQTTTEDSSSVLQQKWSTSSSSDSLKSINQDDDSEERRKSDQFSLKSALNEDALFYHRSFGAAHHHQQQQRPGSPPSIGLHRKWSDSSCSLDSIDQEDEDKMAPAFPGSHHHHHMSSNNNSNGISNTEAPRLKGLSGMLHKKWSASNCSLDSIDNDDDEEDNYEIGSRFPPLIESVRLKDPSPMFHCRNDKEGPIVSSSSSSIGNRSEDSSGSVVSDVDSPGDMEVESSLRGGSHSQLNLSSLESSLPIKRGLSRFWNGKAKSFAFLQDVSSLATLADLAKPENPYNKRRRFSSGFGMRPSSPLSRPHTAGISKKPPSGTGKSCLAIAVAMGSKVENGPKCLSPQSALRNAQRSFSLSDLEHHGINPDVSHAHAAAASTMTRMRR